MADSPQGYDPGWGGLEGEVLAFLDLEATGPMPGDRIVEIGAVLVQEDEVLDRFHAFVDPEIEVPADVRKIHGIGSQLLHGAPRIGEALRALFAFLGRARGLALHHAPADMRFLAYDARRAGLELPDLAVVDTKVMARRMLGRASPSSLYGLCELFGIDCESNHRALPDAECTHRLFRCLLQAAVSAQSRFWSWPRPAMLGEAALPPVDIDADMQDLLPRSPPRTMHICYGKKGETKAWIEVTPLAIIEGRSGPWLRARESTSGEFKFYRLCGIQAWHDSAGEGPCHDCPGCS